MQILKYGSFHSLTTIGYMQEVQLWLNQTQKVQNEAFWSGQAKIWTQI